MEPFEFDEAFRLLTGNPPFPWQRALYDRFLSDRPDSIPPSCTLPTGLGKTNVIAVWLLALAADAAKVPRRLVYVVNRRTVVDQSTDVAKKLRENLHRVPEVERQLDALCALPLFEVPYLPQPPLAISTLRGQFADNREWTADPARPAVVVGTVDMVGSRLLFSGYGCGFKTRPLHAGFLGQDALLVHDEAHLEEPFQKLLKAVECEQAREKRADFGRPGLRVMELTATPRGEAKPFGLTDDEKEPPAVLPDPTEPVHHVWRRLKAKKGIAFHTAGAEKGAVAAKVGELAAGYAADASGPAVLVFVRTIDDIEGVVKRLGKDAQVERLTGTLRGYERDGLVERPVFSRFLPGAASEVTGTVYLVCTSAGEVGIDLSADHMVCDLATLESMAQRLGRVNRRGDGAAKIDIVSGPADPKKADDPMEMARRATLGHLGTLPPCDWVDGRKEASPYELGRLVRRLTEAGERDAAFSPPPKCVPTSDILFDAWALTTVREPLPGRPPVADYLHGIEDETRYETQVAWREEVEHLSDGGYTPKELAGLLEDYPLKPHELLRDVTYRVFEGLEAVAERDARKPEGERLSAWVIAPDETVAVYPLAKLVERDAKKKPVISLAGRTVLLPPAAGGLRDGMLAGDAEAVDDVSGRWLDEDGRPRRARSWDDPTTPAGMRLVRRVEVRSAGADDDAKSEVWRWFVRPRSADDDGSEEAERVISLKHHVRDVVTAAGLIAGKLLPEDLQTVVIKAAEWHDLGKARGLWQRGIGNTGHPGEVWGKSDKKGGFRHSYRHEFGSLLDAAGQAGFADLKEYEDLVLHLIAAHHGRGRPHFPADEAFDPEPKGRDEAGEAARVPRRFARLQRRYGRWGLAYLESLLRASDYAASASPSAEVEGDR